MQKPSFAQLGLSPEILKAVEALGFEEASPIQAAAIPVIKSGRDVVGQSQTGSGKTAAFSIPAIESIDASSRSVQVLVLTPTRELATQVAEEIHKLSAFKRGIHAAPIYGGASYERQFYELKKGVQIVIGTPGRLIDHLDRGTLQLGSLKMVVLDEADRMLDMGFREDIQKILDATPAERQTVFFSATVSQPIRDLIKRYARNPETVRIEQKEITAPTVEQFFYEVQSRSKQDALIRLIDYHGFKLGIVFCNTQRMVEELADALLAQGVAADRLHGGMAQAQRTRVMNKFKKAEFEFLVATDVAARGIDVDDLEVVVNYDLPYDSEDYVHRIGRTGRAGRRGIAATFVSGREIYKLQYIERFTRTKIRRGVIPSLSDVEEKRTDALFERVHETLLGGQYKPQQAFIERLLEQGFNSTDIASALLHHLNPPEKTKTKSGSATLPTNDLRGSLKQPTESPSRPRPQSPIEQSVGKFETEEKPALRKASKGMQWLRLSVGRQHGVGPRDIVELIADTAGVPARTVGIIELQESHCFVQIAEQHVERVERGVSEVVVDGRPVTAERVRPGAAAAGAEDHPPKRVYRKAGSVRQGQRPSR